MFLLVGLPGSGKSTYARALERRGVVRLPVDELVTPRPGRTGAVVLDLLGPDVDEVRLRLVDLVRSGQSVVLDHGIGRRAERDFYKRLVTGNGATWRLVHFVVDRAELLRRLAFRDRDRLTPEAFDWIAAHSEEPSGEGEELPDLALL